MQRSTKQDFVGLWRNEKGATAIEYGLIASLIAVVIIGALMLLNGSMTDLYEQIRAAIVPAIDGAKGTKP